MWIYLCLCLGICMSAEVDFVIHSIPTEWAQPQSATPGVPGPAGRAAPLPGQPANASTSRPR